MQQTSPTCTAAKLQVSEIYASVQGESTWQGLPCTFVRLTGCPLRCRWCDTAYAFEGGEEMDLEAVVAEVRSKGLKLVELTGGEPLAQEATPQLAGSLIERGYTVLIETGGSEPVNVLPSGVHIIMDLKCPDSGMEDRNLWSNLDDLKESDEIKFVLASRKDYDWAKEKIEEHGLDRRFNVLMSCAFAQLKPQMLAEWMVEDHLDRCRMQLQIHKYIWSPKAKGV